VAVGQRRRRTDIDREADLLGGQVTVEKVGVEVRGLAVYRIADPLLAFRMIDGDRSSLTEILRDMFVGATRRIVARLTLDECITHRKDMVAQALMGEIAPILAGEGARATSPRPGGASSSTRSRSRT